MAATATTSSKPRKPRSDKGQPRKRSASTNNESTTKSKGTTTMKTATITSAAAKKAASKPEGELTMADLRTLIEAANAATADQFATIAANVEAQTSRIAQLEDEVTKPGRVEQVKENIHERASRLRKQVEDEGTVTHQDEHLTITEYDYSTTWPRWAMSKVWNGVRRTYRVAGPTDLTEARKIAIGFGAGYVVGHPAGFGALPIVGRFVGSEVASVVVS